MPVIPNIPISKTQNSQNIKHVYPPTTIVPTVFRSKLKRWVKQWRTEMENKRAEYSALTKKEKEARVDGKKSNNVVEPPDIFLEALK